VPTYPDIDTKAANRMAFVVQYGKGLRVGLEEVAAEAAKQAKAWKYARKHS